MNVKNQYGFAHIAGVLIVILVLAVAGGTGCYLWHRHHNQTSGSAMKTSGSAATVSYTDTAKLFTLHYPATWKFDYEPAGSEGTTPDWTKESRPFTLMPTHAPAMATGVTVQTMSKSYADGFITPDATNKIQKLSINGHQAYLDTNSYVGPSAAEKYTDYTYTILSGNNAVVLSFRASYYHAFPAANWNDSQDLSAFKTIAYSVKFLAPAASTSPAARQQYMTIKEWGVTVTLGSDVAASLKTIQPAN